jgi:hypothetical protein
MKADLRIPVKDYSRSLHAPTMTLAMGVYSPVATSSS